MGRGIIARTAKLTSAYNPSPTRPATTIAVQTIGVITTRGLLVIQV
jgi:hypothetical protein